MEPKTNTGDGNERGSQLLHSGVYVCVLLYLLPNEYKYQHSPSKVRTFFGRHWDILTGSHNFRGLFEGQGVLLMFRLGAVEIHYAGESPHNDRSTRVCGCMQVDGRAGHLSVTTIHYSVCSASINSLVRGELVDSRS